MEKDINNKSSVKQVHVQLNFLGHCIYCLRKTKRPEVLCFSPINYNPDSHDLMHIVPKAEVSPSSTSSGSVLNTFNRIWLPLQKKIENETNDGDPFGFLERSGSKASKSTLFTGLPRMCRFCGEKLEKVDKLLKELLGELNGLRKIIQESKYGGKYSWRALEFEEALKNSSMEKESIQATIGFLGGIGKTMETPKSKEQNPIVIEKPKAVQLPKPTSEKVSLQTLATSSRQSNRRKQTFRSPQSTPLPVEFEGTLGNIVDHLDLSTNESLKPSTATTTPEVEMDSNKLNFHEEHENNYGEDSDVMEVDSNSDFQPDLDIESDSEGDDYYDGEIACDVLLNTKARTPIDEDPLQVTENENDTEILPEATSTKISAQNVKRRNLTVNDSSSGKTRGGPIDSSLQAQDDPESGHSYYIGNVKVMTKYPWQRISKENITYTKKIDPHNGYTIITCIIDGCGQTFYSRTQNSSAFSMHQNFVHKVNGEPTKACDICNEKFFYIMDLRRHKQEFHEPPPPPPPDNPRALKKYKRTTRPVKCDLCKDIVPLKSIYQHVLEHVGGEEFLTKCPNPKCRFVCCKLSTLSSHLDSSRACRQATLDIDKYLHPTYTCEVCEFKTGHALTIRAHLIKEHETSEKNFHCPIDGCQQKFTIKQSVILHLPHHDLIPASATQQCFKCPDFFKVYKPDDLEQHLITEHQILETVKCNQCGFVFSSREGLIDHMFFHRFGILTCDICNDGVRFSRHFQLRHHYFQAHKIGQKFACEHCGKLFWDQKYLRSHVRLEHGEGPKRNVNVTSTCEECNVVYKTEEQLRGHNIVMHGAKPFSCRFCSETFTNADRLRKHEKEHRGIHQEPPPEFKCEVEGCEKVFKSKRQLEHHHSVAHLGQRNHVCDTCGKSYATPKSLKDHTEVVHLGLRPFICEVCGESFAISTVLNRHKLIHTAERPFECKICGQRFRQSGVLQRHIQSHQQKGANFKPSGPMKQIRKRVERK